MHPCIEHCLEQCYERADPAKLSANTFPSDYQFHSLLSVEEIIRLFLYDERDPLESGSKLHALHPLRAKWSVLNSRQRMECVQLAAAVAPDRHSRSGAIPA